MSNFHQAKQDVFTFNIMYISTYTKIKKIVEKRRFWENYTKALPELGIYCQTGIVLCHKRTGLILSEYVKICPNFCQILKRNDQNLTHFFMYCPTFSSFSQHLPEFSRSPHMPCTPMPALYAFASVGQVHFPFFYFVLNVIQKEQFSFVMLCFEKQYF